MTTPAWDPALYTAKHSFVYEYGRELVALLAPQRGERILDLGCGSGQLTQAIAESGASVVGLDNSASMIETARKAYPSVSFVDGRQQWIERTQEKARSALFRDGSWYADYRRLRVVAVRV